MPESPPNADSTATPSALSRAAASFLVQALQLPDDPAEIASEFVVLKEDANASIHSVQLDSSIGPAAFLVYVYVLDDVDADGASGRNLYDTGRETLIRAADLDTPGPRMVAHADTDAFGFILATTPATWRALQGEPVEPEVANSTQAPPTPVSEKDRATLAEDLHKALSEANRLAGAWLGAVQGLEKVTLPEGLEFSEEEIALALHVMDDANVRPLLTSLNVLISTAQAKAGDAVKPPEA